MLLAADFAFSYQQTAISDWKLLIIITNKFDILKSLSLRNRTSSQQASKQAGTFLRLWKTCSLACLLACLYIQTHTHSLADKT